MKFAIFITLKFLDSLQSVLHGGNIAGITKNVYFCRLWLLSLAEIGKMRLICDCNNQVESIT